MKKLTMLVATFALAMPGPLAVPTAAVAASNASNVGFCKDYVASGYDSSLTLGQCISLLTTEGHYATDGSSAQGFGTHACQYVQNNYPDEFYTYYATFTDCVQDGGSAFI